jgi:hypothetical protein
MSMKPWQTSLNKTWNRRGKEGTKREDPKWVTKGQRDKIMFQMG